VNNANTGALFDASANWWGSNNPTTVAGMISGDVDFTPLLDSGTDTEPATPGFQPSLSSLTVHTLGSQTGATGRIQEGIDEVTASTVNVAAGTYIEQVTINKSLTLSGAGKASTTIQAPGTLTGDKAIVTITGASVDVELSGFTVKGPGPGTSNSIFAGIFVKDAANGNIHDNDILDIRDEPISSSGEPHGIWLGCNAKSTTGTATIKDNTISGFQKGGIAVERSGSTATIEGNTVTGQGPFLDLAQDGIRVAFSAGPVSIKGNTVTGNEHYGTVNDWDCWGATAIFLREGAHDVDIEGNTLTDNRDGVLIGHGGDTLGVDKVNITDNDITDNTEGIHLQCFGEVAPPTNVHITGNDIQSVFPTGCTYYAPDHCYGIIVDYGAVNTNYAHFNNIAGTGYLGLWNGKEGPGGDIPDFDATCNWWGDNSGPAHSSNPGGTGNNVSDNVDYDPWLLEVPTVTTEAATGVDLYTATLNMDYTVGGYSSVQVRFGHKKSDATVWYYTDWVSKTADGSHSEALDGLASGTIYDFKAQLRYDETCGGETMIEGTTLQFTTVTPLVPPSPFCFIATAAYGSPTAEQLDVLREFRDTVLLESTLGSQFVSLYYQTSPPIADFIAENEILRTLVRELLVDPIVWVVDATGNMWRN